MRLALVQPCIGRRPGQRYLRTWQMEPLPLAVLAGLTPRGVEVRLHDDRMEEIAYDAPADLVAITVETYTARRAYEIATEYRRRGVPVVMGGFHATLCPDEVARHAEAVVVGEAEGVWPEVLDDFRAGRPKKTYRATARPSLERADPDRSIFRGKRYLPVGLVEAGRGCPHRCDFCSVQSAYGPSRTARPIEKVLADVERARRDKRLLFFVDDNIGADRAAASELFRALARARTGWMSQCSIDAAHDPALVELMARSGCEGLLMGFESLEPGSLRAMAKGWNSMRGGYGEALENLRRRGIRVYGTFVHGYDADRASTLAEAVAFARRERMFMAAFAHLMPFPGTPLYRRLASEGRLLFDRWWVDPAYRFGQLAYRPAGLDAADVREACLAARRAFFSWRSILSRARSRTNGGTPGWWWAYLLVNWMHRAEIDQRDGHPLGDPAFQGPLLEAS